MKECNWIGCTLLWGIETAMKSQILESTKLPSKYFWPSQVPYGILMVLIFCICSPFVRNKAWVFHIEATSYFTHTHTHTHTHTLCVYFEFIVLKFSIFKNPSKLVLVYIKYDYIMLTLQFWISRDLFQVVLSEILFFLLCRNKELPWNFSSI